jgi:hypothetical protein
MLHEGAQGLNNVVGVDLRPPGNDEGVDKAPTVTEGQQHLLGGASLDTSINGPGLPFSIHCSDCFLVPRVG